MLDLLPLAFSGIALLMAVLALPGMAAPRLVVCLFALGCGQIYLAVLAFGALLVIDNRWRITRPASFKAMLWGGVLICGVLLTTMLSPITTRTYSELAQLALYIVLLLLTLSYIKSGEDLLRFLQCSVVAAVSVAIVAMITVYLGWQTPPYIFLARGSNEGAVFLSLTGVIPAAALFVRSRNPGYFGAAVFVSYVQYIATSRGSLIVSIVALLMAFFFLFHNKVFRGVLVAAGLYLVSSNLPYVNSIYRGQINFSARERLSLLEHGIYLWRQRPWIGWGWGSTTDLAERAPTTVLRYPHFHNTYVQLLVETGAVGVLIFGTFLYFWISRSLTAVRVIAQPAVSMLAVSVGAGLVISGFFDAMLYGADRTVQVVILLALVARAVALGMKVDEPRASQPGPMQPEPEPAPA
jgi:O-antigen ligase